MRYFEALTNALFQKDPEGNTLFYTWGVFGRGIIVDTETRKARISTIITQFYIIFFILIFLQQGLILFLPITLVTTLLLFLGMSLFLGGWYVIALHRITKGLPYSPYKLTMKQGWKSTAITLPRYVIWLGLIGMVFLTLLSLVSFFIIASTHLWASIFLLLLGLFGTYAYSQMLQLSKGYHREHPPTIVPKNDNAIQWNTKNIILIILLIMIIVGIVSLSYWNSKQNFNARMARYDAMSVEAMATYLAGINKDPEQLDPVTRHAGTTSKAHQIYFYRELEAGFLSDVLVDLNAIDEEKWRMSQQLKREMCYDLPTYERFYRKGGEVIYVYHQLQGTNKVFLFDITINEAFCL